MQDNPLHLTDELIAIQEQKEKKEAEQLRQLLEAVRLVFSTDAGKILGAWLYSQCTTGQQNNDINPNKLIYYKGKEDLYNSLRGLMSKENIVNIELGGFN